MFIDAAYFYLNQITSTKMANKLHIRIEMRKGKGFERHSKATQGVAYAKADGSSKTEEVTIYLRRDRDYRANLKTLKHEIKHAAQRAKNELQYRQWRTDGKYHVRWKGKDVGTVGDIPYRDRPWEVEARKAAETADTFPGYEGYGKYLNWKNKQKIVSVRKRKVKTHKRPKKVVHTKGPVTGSKLNAKIHKTKSKKLDRFVVLRNNKGREVYKRYFTPKYSEADMKKAIERIAKRLGNKGVNW